MVAHLRDARCPLDLKSTGVDRGVWGVLGAADQRGSPKTRNEFLGVHVRGHPARG